MAPDGGTTEVPRHRPGPVNWVRYAYGGGLNARHRGWVLYDTTCRTWAARHVARSLLQMSPVVLAILLLVPGPLWIRAMSSLGGLIMGLIFSLGYMVETTEHRLVKAGYPVGTAERVREQRSTTDRSEAVARRRAKMLNRMDRRLGSGPSSTS
ncbi:MAG: hypothetical protein QOK10_2396 [Pseudonocardiales bacterium]|nr:hypothetical protein [Pseudonocardiales bacterium]